MNKIKNADKGMRFFKISAVLFAYTALVLLLCIFSRSFCESYCRSVCSALRFVLSQITGIFPFSVAEILLLALVPLVALTVIFGIIRKKFRLRLFLRMISGILLVAAFVFFNAFGVCYLRAPVEKNMDFELREITRDELLDAAEYVKRELEKAADAVEFEESGASVNPHEWAALNQRLDYGYERLQREYPFISYISADAKKIALSPLMTYTHISGIFIPFTGEANVNTNYPDYVVAFSASHEKAHQRGIAGEDEASFVAFLACLASEDEYLRYASLLSMYDYYLDEIYKTDKEQYRRLLEKTDRRILSEMYAYSVFFDKYRDSAASQVADSVNDTYIKAMGDSDGVESYSRVARLCTSYLIEKQALPY